MEKRKKTVERTKKRRPIDLLINQASHWMTTISPKVLVCQALKEKIKLERERNSWRVAEWFRDAVLDCLKLQNLRIMKAKAKRR